MFTLCWDCKNATDGGCSWSEKLEPVKGWEAIENARGHLVVRCPEFERDTYGFGFFRTEEEFKEMRGIMGVTYKDILRGNDLSIV